MSNNTTLVNLGSIVREYFSGITRESVGQFCSAKKDYVVNCVRNIPGYMQESHSNAATILFGANVLGLAILNYTLLSPIERRMEASTADPERLLSKKQWLNLLGVGTVFYALNVGLIQLHKYQLSRDLLLLIAATAVVYRLLGVTIPQVARSNGELTARETAAVNAFIAERAAGLAEQRALQAEALVPDATQDPLAAALQARTDLPGLRQVEEESKNPNEIRALALAYAELVEQLLLSSLAEEANAARVLLRANPCQEQTQEIQIRLMTSLADAQRSQAELQGILTRVQQARAAVQQAREAAGEEHDGNIPPDSILGRAEAAIGARETADQTISDNQAALEDYDSRLRSAQEAREAATQARTAATTAQQAAEALLPPVPPVGT